MTFGVPARISGVHDLVPTKNDLHSLSLPGEQNPSQSVTQESAYAVLVLLSRFIC